MLKKTFLPTLIFFAVASAVFGFEYEFAQPSYDSGWRPFAQNEIKILTHDLGGSVDDYVVNMQFRDDGGNKVNQVYFGGRDGDTVGATWYKLTTSSITIDRGYSDVNCEEIRVRIWMINRASFDSGWMDISQGQTKTLTHSIGGSVDDYVVYLELKDNESFGINQKHYGGSAYETEPATPVSMGAYWRNLNNSSIQVFRCQDDKDADQIRVRIWKASHPDYDSGWQAAGAETTFNHNLGGPWNDYVVDMQFKDTEDYGVNHRFYGGGPSSYESGAYWKNLNGSHVSVVKQGSAAHIDQVRVRLWKSSAPKYDSGWVSLSPSAYLTLGHSLGGNPDDYVVDLQFKDTLFSINNHYYGGRKCYDALSVYTRYRGAYWYRLDNGQVWVYRSGDDVMAGQVRVRLWVPPRPDYDSGWTNISAGTSQTFTHGLGGGDDDYVVYLEFKNSAGAGVHQMDYGGDWWWNNSDVLYMYGAYWDNLSPTSVRVTRQQNDTLIEQVRVRIWKNDSTPVPRYAWKSDWTMYENAVWNVVTHDRGGNVDDYVLDMRFKDTGLHYTNQFFYGSMYGKNIKAGAYYQNLNVNSLEVVREINDGVAANIMLRIWKAVYAPKTVFVSGHISSAGNPLSNVAVTFSGAGGGTCYTDSNGNYSMALPYDYSGTATPSRSGYAFTPPHTDYGSLVANTITDYTADEVPSLTVTSPTGTSNWKTGTAYNITWTSTGAVGNVKIDLLQGGALNMTIAANTANDGLESWTPPGSLVTAGNYQIKISSVSNAAIYDTSPNFTITKTVLTVILPNGGEAWLVGSHQNIIWTSPAEVGNVKIEYSTNGGANYTQITASTSNTGTYPWTVPNAISSNCLVKISNAAVPSMFDVSDAVFSIVGAVVKKDFVGTWDGQGVYYRNSETGKWTKLSSPANLIAAGDLGGDGKEDLICVFSSPAGVWVRSSSAGTWTKFASASPKHISSGDMNGDGRDDFLATWDGQGIFCRNSISGIWVKMGSPANLLTAGDLDGDSIEDLICVFPSPTGVWAKFSKTGKWVRLSSTSARDMACGDMNGDGRDDFLATWDGVGVFYRNSISGAWIKMGQAAEQVTAGDLDGDGADDLIGLWTTSGGVYVKSSKTGTWAKLGNPVRDMATGLMRGAIWGGSRSGFLPLDLPVGGYAEGPGNLMNFQDKSAEGPGGWRFAFQVEKNLIPQNSGEALAIPGPGDPRFVCLEQDNLFPQEQEKAVNEKRERESQRNTKRRRE